MRPTSVRHGIATAALLLLSLLATACGGTAGDETPAGEDESHLKGFPALPAPPPEYADGLAHSQMTAPIVTHLQQVVALGKQRGRRQDAFSKVGDSITVSTSFLQCFEGRRLEGPHADLEATRAFFDHGTYKRTSESATVGWMTVKALRGTPPPIEVELEATNPAFAIVMYGTNDTFEGTATQFTKNLDTLVGTILDRGVVPLLSTIPFRIDPTFDAMVPDMNAIIRHVASKRQVPLMDFHLALAELPRHGISSDGIHPEAFRNGACVLDDQGLEHGYNQRNLVALTALDRARRFVLDGETPESKTSAKLAKAKVFGGVAEWSKAAVLNGK